MSKMNKLSLRSFTDDSDGTVTIESLISLPLLLFWFVATFVFFGAYKSWNTTEKATAAITDMISRQQEGVPLTQDYLVGVNKIFNFLVNNEGPTDIRVTSVEYDATTNQYIALWSAYSGGGLGEVTTGLLNSTYRTRMPELEPGQTFVFVETYMDYKPAFNVGINNQTMVNYAPAHPRFVNRIEYSTVASP